MVLRRLLVAVAVPAAILLPANARAVHVATATNSAGLTAAQVSTVDHVLSANGVSPSTRHAIENDRKAVEQIAVTWTKRVPPPTVTTGTAAESAAAPTGADNHWGSCTYWYWLVNSAPVITAKDVFGATLFWQVDHLGWLLGANQTSIRCAGWPVIEPHVSALGSAAWNYIGAVDPFGEFYTYLTGHPWSGFYISTTTHWQACLVKYGCVQNVYPNGHAHEHSTNNGGCCYDWITWSYTI